MPVGPLRQLQLEFRNVGRDVHAPDETGDQPALQLAPVAVVEDVLQHSVMGVKAQPGQKSGQELQGHVLTSPHGTPHPVSVPFPTSGVCRRSWSARNDIAETD